MPDCSPLVEKLKEYKACPIPPGMAWACVSWYDPDAETNRTATLRTKSMAMERKSHCACCAGSSISDGTEEEAPG